MLTNAKTYKRLSFRFDNGKLINHVEFKLYLNIRHNILFLEDIWLLKLFSIIYLIRCQCTICFFYLTRDTRAIQTIYFQQNQSCILSINIKAILPIIRTEIKIICNGFFSIF